jgi:hypothetical protein
MPWIRASVTLSTLDVTSCRRRMPADFVTLFMCSEACDDSTLDLFRARSTALATPKICFYPWRRESTSIGLSKTPRSLIRGQIQYLSVHPCTMSQTHCRIDLGWRDRSCYPAERTCLAEVQWPWSEGHCGLCLVKEYHQWWLFDPRKEVDRGGVTREVWLKNFHFRGVNILSHNVQGWGVQFTSQSAQVSQPSRLL